MRGLEVPEPTEDFTADPVELFFDLAFVYAFSRLVWLLVHDPTWEGAGEAAMLFTVLWLVWSTFTWAANAVQGNARPVRAIFLVATAASVPVGASVTTAFGSGGVTFAVGASLIVGLGISLQLWGLSGDGVTAEEYRSVLRYGIPNIAAGTLLIIGSFVDGDARTVLWSLFILAALAGVRDARSGTWIVRPGHFAERHGLILIVALGEVVVAIGLSVVESLEEADGLPGVTLVGLIAAGILAGLLWWSYFDRVQPALEHHSTALEGNERSRFTADTYTGMHLLIVGGVIALAAAVEEILLHPRDEVPTPFLVMFVGGVLLFYAGIAAAVARSYRIVAVERLVTVLAVAAVAVIGSSWDGIVVLVVVDVIVALGLMAEYVRIEQPSTTSTTTADA
ncbi:MAG: low temperature requirement protein A [Actinomycetota bacterium]